MNCLKSPIILILGIVFFLSVILLPLAYYNDVIFSDIILQYLNYEKISIAKNRYKKLPGFMQKRLLKCQTNNLLSPHDKVRLKALNFISVFCGIYPSWRKYAAIGFYDEENSQLMFKRIYIIVNGQRSLFISERTALKYQDLFKHVLNSPNRFIRAQAIIGLASAYRNDEAKFKKYIFPFVNDPDTYVRKTAYIYIRFWGPKNWKTFLMKKKKTETSPAVKRIIKTILSPDSGKLSQFNTKEEQNF